jgi:hypothetical protein
MNGSQTNKKLCPLIENLFKIAFKRFKIIFNIKKVRLNQKKKKTRLCKSFKMKHLSKNFFLT